MYQNPHQQYNQQQQLLMLQAQQRAAQNQMGQQMNPQMMQILMQQMMQNPQMMQMLMQGQQNPQMMQQMNPQMQQQHSGIMPNQQVSAARFGGGPMQAQQQPQQAFTQGADSSRFATPSEEAPAAEEETAFSIPKYTVSTKHGSYPLTKKLGIPPKVTAFNVKQLHSSDKVSICTSVKDAAKKVAEEFLELDDTKLMIAADSIIVDDGFTVKTDVVMLTNLFQDDIKGLYKRLRAAYTEVTSIDVAIMLNRIDERFTELTNEYLTTHLKCEIFIDRFSLDFNDLLKVLRDSFEDEEDDLWEYLSKEVKEIYELLSDQSKEDKEVFRFRSGISLVSFKEHHFKAGLDEVKKQLVEIDGQETHNLFLLTMAKHIFEMSDRKVFYFSTYDCELFKFSLNNKGEVFVVRQ